MIPRYGDDNKPDPLGMGILVALLLMPLATASKWDTFHRDSIILFGLLGLAALGALTVVGGAGYGVYWYFFTGG